MRPLLAVVCLLVVTSVASAAGVSGRWSGSFVISNPDGSTKNDSALLILRQEGSMITGTAGGDESQQSPISNGIVDKNRVTFDFKSHGIDLRFDLTLVDGHLKGEARGVEGSAIRRATLDLVPSTSEADLVRTITALDAKVFDAYNRCDLEEFGSYFAEDVEFYHDKGGVTLGRASLVDSVRNNVCGKTHRDLVPGSLEVYPIPGYGAMELAAHRFCPPATAPCGEASKPAKTAMVWRFKDGAWQVTRVLSYAH